MDVVVDSGAAENVMPRGACSPKYSPKKRKGPSMDKGFRGPVGEHIKNYGQQVMSVRTLEGFVRKSTWQVPPVSASHIIQAGNALLVHGAG